MSDFLWTVIFCPQARFLLFPQQAGCANMPCMFNHDRWEMKDYPRLFLVSDHARFGITRHSLYHSNRYPSVLPGVRMDQQTLERHPTPLWADQDWKWDALRLRAASLRYSNIAASHATAARLFGWPLPPNLMTSQLHLSTGDKSARIRHQQITLHRPTQMSSMRWLDLPILAAEDVFIGIGPDLLLRDLVMLGDAAVGNWHGSPQISLPTLQQAVRSRSRLRRGDHLLAALDLIRPTVDSPAETNLRLWARAVGLPEPIVHPRVFCRLLNREVEPDLGYPDEKLALEYEGEHHLRSKNQWNSDIDRDEGLRNEGWTVIKVTSRTDYGLLEAKIRHHLGLSRARW